MPTLKIFAASSTMVPLEWKEAAGFERHHQQGTVVVVAHVKRDAAVLLNERMIGRWGADSLAASLRYLRPPITWRDIELLLNAGVIDPAAPGIYVWHDGVNNDPIVRVDPDGTPVIIGHFRFGGGGLYVEPITEG